MVNSIYFITEKIFVSTTLIRIYNTTGSNCIHCEKEIGDTKGTFKAHKSVLFRVSFFCFKEMDFVISTHFVVSYQHISVSYPHTAVSYPYTAVSCHQNVLS